LATWGASPGVYRTPITNRQCDQLPPPIHSVAVCPNALCPACVPTPSPPGLRMWRWAGDGSEQPAELACALPAGSRWPTPIQNRESAASSHSPPRTLCLQHRTLLDRGGHQSGVMATQSADSSPTQSGATAAGVHFRLRVFVPLRRVDGGHGCPPDTLHVSIATICLWGAQGSGAAVDSVGTAVHAATAVAGIVSRHTWVSASVCSGPDSATSATGA